MSIEFGFSLDGHDAYVIRASILSWGSPGCSRIHAGGHGDPDSCSDGEPPEVEIDEIEVDDGSGRKLAPAEWDEYGFDDGVIRHLEEKTLHYAAQEEDDGG